MPDLTDSEQKKLDKYLQELANHLQKAGIPVQETVENMPPREAVDVNAVICLTCEKTGGEIVKCQGPCRGHYHTSCQSLTATTASLDMFKCKECMTGEFQSYHSLLNI